MVLRNLFLFIILIFLPRIAFLQKDTYKPLNYVCNNKTIFKDLGQQLRDDLGELPLKDREIVREVYEKRTKSIRNNIINEHYLFHNPINAYFENLLAIIIENNPEIQNKKLRLLISRYPWPNAACFGEGTFVINIGLIRRMENVDQMAFILCHELAHYIDDHVNNAILDRSRKIERLSKSKKLRKLRKQEYGKYDDFLNLLEGIVYEDRRHSRLKETEADSLGLALYMNSGFDPNEAPRVMEVLNNIDKQKYPGEVGLDKIFSSEEYPFKKRWLRTASQGLSLMNVQSIDKEWNSDSLKTHPDCIGRRDLLIQQIGSPLEFNLEPQELYQNFEDIVEQSDFEMVQSFYDFEDFGRTIYYACQLLNKYPENAFLKAMISRSLYRIYFEQENHTLSDYVDLPGSHNKSYNQILQFIHNLRLIEIEQINYHFLQKDKLVMQNDEEYLFSLWLCATLMDNEIDVENYKSLYLSNFSNGKYREIIQFED